MPTFEQHCEGSEPALRVEVHIANPAPPPQLELGLAIAVDGTASTLNGKATVGGTVTRNGPVNVSVAATVTQVVKRALVTGSAGLSVDRTPRPPVPWQVRSLPTGRHLSRRATWRWKRWPRHSTRPRREPDANR
jgi:hypothetical protein